MPATTHPPITNTSFEHGRHSIDFKPLTARTPNISAVGKTPNFSLGASALFSNFIGIAMFILSGQALEFWSATWIAMLINLGLLLGISLFFLNAANDQRTNTFLPLASGAYGLISCVAILTSLYFSGLRDSSIGAFLGLALLITFPMAMARFASEASDGATRRPLSYLYAMTGAIAIIGLMFKHMSNPELSFSMLGEMIILSLTGMGVLVFSRGR